MTQAELAGLSPLFLSMVEHGSRMLDRRSHIAAVASALRVSETDLVGGPHLSQDRVQSDPHMGIPPLRVALQTNTLTSAAVDRARPLSALRQIVFGRLEPMRRACDYLRMGQLLPDVLDELHHHVARPADQAAQRLALEASALTSAVPCARRHTRQVRWEWGLKELIDTCELVVSELATDDTPDPGPGLGRQPPAAAARKPGNRCRTRPRTATRRGPDHRLGIIHHARPAGKGRLSPQPVLTHPDTTADCRLAHLDQPCQSSVPAESPAPRRGTEPGSYQPELVAAR